VNTLAPYMLTALTGRPDRLIDLSSGLHRAGAGPLRDIDRASRPWNPARTHSQSTLHITAFTLARVWPQVLANAADPSSITSHSGLRPGNGGQPRPQRQYGHHG
jgi:hypothetical protein